MRRGELLMGCGVAMAIGSWVVGSGGLETVQAVLENRWSRAAVVLMMFIGWGWFLFAKSPREAKERGLVMGIASALVAGALFLRS